MRKGSYSVTCAFYRHTHTQPTYCCVFPGEFVNGLAEGKIEAALQPVSALRLVVHSNSDVWALLSEV